MAHYMIEFKYGIDNIKGLVQKPENRTTLIRQSLESSTENCTASSTPTGSMMVCSSPSSPTAKAAPLSC